MRYFKYIDIDNYPHIKEKSIKFVEDVFLTQRRSMFQQFNWENYLEYCPEIMEAFTRYDLVPYTGFVYIIYKQEDSPLHIDYISKIHNKCRINLPLVNCEFSKTIYYKTPLTDFNAERVVQGDVMTDPNNEENSKLINYLKFNEDDPGLSKVDEVVVDKPTIMRVQEAHRVMIDSTKVPRVVLTIHTYKDPVYLLEDETC